MNFDISLYKFKDLSIYLIWYLAKLPNGNDIPQCTKKFVKIINGNIAVYKSTVPICLRKLYDELLKNLSIN